VELPELHSRSRLHAAGFTDGELRQLVRHGELTTVRRGSYLQGAPPDDAVVWHAVAARAALERLADGAVCSHVTAAVLHGLPLWPPQLDRVHVTRSRRTGGRSSSQVVMHSAPLDPGEICVATGMLVTSVARTLVDLGRTVPFEQAVTALDAALHRGLVDQGTLQQALARATRWRGAPAARRAIGFADGRSESVGESRSRVAIMRSGLPVPVPQWEVVDTDGTLIARTDFGWPQLNTVGEFDGRIKYGRLLLPGQEPGDVIYAEKLREDRLRDEGLGVVRWTWADLTDFTRTAERLRRRFRGPER
jgi:hypothetical protein